MENQIRCPKCKSTQLHADKKGFSTGKAVAGSIVGGVLTGAIIGGIGKNEIIITCLKCGHQFVPGEGVTIKNIENRKIDKKYNVVVCNKCSGKTSASHLFCCEYRKAIDENDKLEISKPLSVKNCSNCNNRTTANGIILLKMRKKETASSIGLY